MALACSLSSGKPCAYCKLHHSTMSVKQVKHRECLRKQCFHMVKIEEHPWWKEREVMKQRRIERKYIK